MNAKEENDDYWRKAHDTTKAHAAHVAAMYTTLGAFKSACRMGLHSDVALPEKILIHRILKGKHA